MYTVTNFKSKAALKRAIAAGEEVETYQPGGLFPAETEGKIYLEGPHYPEPHRWYASAQVKDGIIIKGTVK
tara:strand:+ start:1330 stop:1542 length:213 start_codon:yes stop_codon:yes gene_type:complete